MKLTEKQIQNQILDYLAYLPGCKAWPNQSMGVYDPVRKTFRRQGGHHNRGVADIIGIYRGWMICIEVKSATGKLASHQAEFLEEMNQRGAIAFVARSLEDVIAKLGSIEKPPRVGLL